MLILTLDPTGTELPEWAGHFRCHQTEGATGGTVLCLVDLKDIRLEVELSIRDVPCASLARRIFTPSEASGLEYTLGPPKFYVAIEFQESSFATDPIRLEFNSMREFRSPKGDDEEAEHGGQLTL